MRGLANVIDQCLIRNFRSVHKEVTHPSDVQAGHRGCQLLHLGGERAGGQERLAGRPFQILEGIGDFRPERLLLELSRRGCGQVQCADPRGKAALTCTERHRCLLHGLKQLLHLAVWLLAGVLRIATPRLPSLGLSL